MPQAAKRRRTRGSIESLPSGALRVSVYAGIDPVTKRRLYLRETVPAGPKATQQAEKVRTRLQNQVDEKRNPKTRATVGELIDRYMSVHAGEESTRDGYQNKIDCHIKPLLGAVPLAKLEMDGSEILDSFYAELRRCREHCDGRPHVEHRTDRPHTCDEHRAVPCSPPAPDTCRACRRMCREHVCCGLGHSSILQIHWILSGAFKRGKKWKWMTTNPTGDADPPSQPAPNPQPPTASEAARLIDGASRIGPDWGAFVWTKMTIGARRGEMCALRWHDIDLDNEIIHLRRAIYVRRRQVHEKDTKTHQQRRLVIDPETVHVLTDLQQRARQRAHDLGMLFGEDGYVFTSSPDGLTPLLPDSVSQKYKRMADRLHIDTTIKNLRDYSATELIHAGVNARIVAGRLGHGGGGATTLKVYTAWSSEADQRAAGSMTARMPKRPEAAPTADSSGSVYAEREEIPEDHVYKHMAADLRGAIKSGALAPGDHLPTVKALAERYNVVPSTAHRAITQLVEGGLVNVSRGKRAVVS